MGGPGKLTLAQKIAPNVGMIRTIDDFVEKLLKNTPEDNLDAMRASVSVATKWIAVRHKLLDQEEMHGSGISGYREALTSSDGGGAGKPPSRKRGAEPGAGADLDAFRQRLPDSGIGDILDHRKGARREVDPAARNGGSVRAGVAGNAVTFADDTGNDSDL